MCASQAGEFFVVKLGIVVAMAHFVNADKRSRKILLDDFASASFRSRHYFDAGATEDIGYVDGNGAHDKRRYIEPEQGIGEILVGHAGIRHILAIHDNAAIYGITHVAFRVLESRCDAEP